MWYPGSGVALDCIDFLIFVTFLTLYTTNEIVHIKLMINNDDFNFEICLVSSHYDSLS